MSATTGTGHPNVNYLLDSGPAEIKRLSEQHFFVKAVFDHPDLLPAAVDRKKIRRVLDAAAGTAAWALDLSDQPFASSYEIYASDITLSKFPPEDVLQRARIRTLQQDLTKPFPDDMKGTFDLVHTAALVVALTEDDWNNMLKNVYDLLAPGGYLVVADSDLIVYTAEDPPPPDGTPHDLDARIGGPTIVHAIDNILVGLARERGFVIGLSYRLRDMLRAAGFSILSRQRVLVPNGALLDTQLSANGNSLARFRKPVTENPSPNPLMDAVTRLLLSQGKLEAPKGVTIDNEEDRVAFLKAAQQAMDDGVLAVASEWVAQKSA
ncbi:unnamed protein product [Peniophora sp. CBMAI 1063]|nr:unnamed protein product [Peniophora sp. CBMAI 1063]